MDSSFSFPINLLAPEPTYVNYERLLGGEEIPYLRQMVNSVIIAVSQRLTALRLDGRLGIRQV